MKWRENMAMKALAFIAAVAAFTATAIMGWYQLANFNVLWDDGYYSTYGGVNGYTQRYLIGQDYYSVRELVNLKEREARGEELGWSQKQSLTMLEEQFDPANTSLRWQLLDQEGKVLYGNSDGDGFQMYQYLYPYTRGAAANINVTAGWDYWQDLVHNAVNMDGYDGECYNDAWREELPGLVEMAQERDDPVDGAMTGFRFVEGFNRTELTMDTALMDDSGLTHVLRVSTPEGLYIYAPTVRACLDANRFGYRFDPGSLDWVLVEDRSEPAEEASLVLWVEPNSAVDDQYWRAYENLSNWQINREAMLGITIVCAVAGLLLMIFLCCGAGHKRDVEGVYLNWFHRVPGDVLMACLFLGGAAAATIGVELAMDAYGDAPMFIQLLSVGAGVSVTAALCMAALITVCARCKAHTLLRNTWTWAICAWCWRVFLRCLGGLWELFGTGVRAVRAVPLVWKAVAACMAYSLFTFWMIASWRYYGSGTLFLWLAATFLAALYLCAWAYQWKKIRMATQEIIGGNPNCHIDTRHMLPDLRGHADELNNLGHAISAAVDDRLKSEHFKAELITNVSHDLKTPLTSIINYVDLLKKEDIGNPKAAEYIEVLDRKSQRLKKLTEDLVEASKASTGNLTVNWERLDWAQLTDQALAETGERLEAQKLTVVRSLPEEPMWVEADGRHLWRVLDNLLTNCAKYALPGTRVYVDLRRSGDWAVLSVKNISRDALDIPAERLMERFVRGDESRNQAGSGLGLSIAQSLTELQHGRFEISIDGDLFKAIVTLPLAGDRPQDPIQLIL